MKPEFKQYLGIPYEFANGPETVLLGGDSLENTRGINCQTLVHMIFLSLGKPLPPNLLSQELYEDRGLFESLTEGEEPLMFDIFIFGRKKEKDLRKLHLAVYTGENDEVGNPLLLHANGKDRRVTIWSLREFSQYPRYRKLWTIKRLRNLI